VGLEQGVVELALGAEHACARTSDGNILCWGNNASGQVGVSTLGDITSPQQVAGVSGAKQIVAGDQHTCALLGSPGAVSCWGANDNAQVGNGSTQAAVTSPAMVAGVTDAVELVGGGEHTCARRLSGGVTCWGYNYLGQLGNGSTLPTRATQPQTVVELDDAAQLAAGRYHTCALRKGGSVACWGLNAKGELGDGMTQDSSSPVAVMNLSAATFVAAGSWHTCAATAPGQVLCWGDDLGGQLGDGRVTNTANPEPISAQGLP
jgi:alpha-tubulin suppressor-like RCC1 family protein